MSRLFYIIFIALMAFIDHGIKFLVKARLEPHGSKIIIKNVLQLRYVENTGAAFGLMSSSTNVLSVITGIILACGIIILMMNKIKDKFLSVCMLLVISGGLCNLIDRIFRGYVVDYIEPLFVDFAIFNFADMLVVCGSFMIIGYLIRDIINDSKKSKGVKS